MSWYVWLANIRRLVHGPVNSTGDNCRQVSGVPIRPSPNTMSYVARRTRLSSVRTSRGTYPIANCQTKLATNLVVLKLAMYIGTGRNASFKN